MHKVVSVYACHCQTEVRSEKDLSKSSLVYAMSATEPVFLGQSFESH